MLIFSKYRSNAPIQLLECELQTEYFSFPSRCVCVDCSVDIRVTVQQPRNHPNNRKRGSWLVIWPVCGRPCSGYYHHHFACFKRGQETQAMITEEDTQHNQILRRFFLSPITDVTLLMSIIISSMFFSYNLLYYKVCVLTVLTIYIYEK